MPKRSSKDLNETAFAVVQRSVSGHGEPAKPEKNPAAVALGRLGGKKGGKARAEILTAEARLQIAKKAAAARWSKKM